MSYVDDEGIGWIEARWQITPPKGCVIYNLSAEERRSDMRTVTVQYEIWQTEKRDDKDQIVREEDRIGKMHETHADRSEVKTEGDGCAIGSFRERILQDHLEDLAKNDPPLKLTDVEVRARPFP